MTPLLLLWIGGLSIYLAAYVRLDLLVSKIGEKIKEEGETPVKTGASSPSKGSNT